MASPGAGKTTLLERTIDRLNGELRLCVIEGDPATSIDTDRITAAGVPAVQINTGRRVPPGSGHGAGRAARAQSGEADVVIIENVGNLLCPTGWDLGEDAKVLVASLTEGDDKPLKYPMSFASAQAVVINKIDLEPYIPAKVARLRANALPSTPTWRCSRCRVSPGRGLTHGWTGFGDPPGKKRQKAPAGA